MPNVAVTDGNIECTLAESVAVKPGAFGAPLRGCGA